MPTEPPPEDLVRLPPRDPQASKRDHGRVVVVGGAPGMAGAPALAAMAALKSGAGLVELLVPDSVAAIAAAFDPCVMTRGLPAEAEGGFAAAAEDTLVARLTAADAGVVGPGIGRTAAVRDIVRRLWRDVSAPVVFDADALWALSAAEIDAVVVFKGAGTLVVAPGRQARNDTGNPGMATAGTGDVLAGVIAAILGQGLAPLDAARLGVWVHGRAGDAAAADLGEISMTARDLLDRLHVGFRAADCRPQ
ncbi:MAG: hypothetical protein LW698_01425 [Planctomycetaceae bacterium]|nr:hypothetical protein [Planctomycetaceae bacterium]